MEDELHLVEDELDLLFVGEAAVSLNLNFLDYFACFINFAVCLIHLDQALCDSSILLLEHHLAFRDFSKRCQKVKDLISLRNFRQVFVMDKCHHRNDGLFRLTTALDKHKQPLTHFNKLFPVPSESQDLFADVGALQSVIIIAEFLLLVEEVVYLLVEGCPFFT